MKFPTLTNDGNELVVKKVAWINFIFGIPAIILFALSLFFNKETRPFFKEHLFATVGLILMILLAFFFLVRNSLDGRIKMAITNQGIWLPGIGLLGWQNIHYYYFEEVQGEGADTTLLKIGLYDSTKEIKVDISFFNTNEKDIEKAIRLNSGEYNVIGLQ